MPYLLHKGWGYIYLIIGMVWDGMGWDGMGWHGMAWDGIDVFSML